MRVKGFKIVFSHSLLLRAHRLSVCRSTMSSDAKVPVTIITGFLGAGKTTLGVPPLRDREFGTHSAPHLTIPSDPRTLPPFPFFAVNHILTAKHGKRIAIIENEFGEVGIDDGLVIHAEEEIFEMNNGCICCTVRQDLVRILGKLMRRKDKFDHIIIETTGLADPAPVAQTFSVDEELKEQLYLDAIVTICDARSVCSS